MRLPWRPLALAAAFSVTVVAGVATAQTVVVKNAPPGSTIELVWNTVTTATVKASAEGEARLAVTATVRGADTENDSRVVVDTCGTSRRVSLVESRQQPEPAAAGCVRAEVPGLYVLRRVTTLLLDVGGAEPTVWLRQGPIPLEWLRPGPDVPSSHRARSTAPTGLVAFGGGGIAKLSDVVVLACGNVDDCSGKDWRVTFGVGGDVWITQYLGAEVSYLKPANVAVNGKGDTYRFSSSLETDIVSFAAKAGVPINQARIYGKVGLDYHRAIFSTTQSVDDTTLTIDEVEQTIPGGTQTFETWAKGWGWMFGGGLEVWVSPSVAIYGEFQWTKLKGSATDAEKYPLANSVTSALFGVRVRISR